MRALIPILIALMLGGILLAVTWSRDAGEERAREEASTRAAVDRIRQEIRYRAATEQGDVNGRGWPTWVDASWFADRPPRNMLVPRDRPWLEIASSAEADLEDPPMRQSVGRDHAAFWYNPANGVVRARVGPSVSDRAAIETYNRVNGSRITSLFDTEWDPTARGDGGVELAERLRALDEGEVEGSGPRVIVRRVGPMAEAAR